MTTKNPGLGQGYRSIAQSLSGGFRRSELCNTGVQGCKYLNPHTLTPLYSDAVIIAWFKHFLPITKILCKHTDNYSY